VHDEITGIPGSWTGAGFLPAQRLRAQFDYDFSGLQAPGAGKVAPGTQVVAILDRLFSPLPRGSANFLNLIEKSPGLLPWKSFP
jgi:hypothetical protein